MKTTNAAIKEIKAKLDGIDYQLAQLQVQADQIQAERNDLRMQRQKFLIAQELMNQLSNDKILDLSFMPRITKDGQLKEQIPEKTKELIRADLRTGAKPRSLLVKYGINYYQLNGIRRQIQIKESKGSPKNIEGIKNVK